MCAEIPLTKIVEIQEPKKYKLHVARWNGKDEPLDVYVRDEWRDWNTWRSTKDEFSRQYVFSMMDFYHESNMWLFGGSYEVTGRGEKNSHSYKLRDLPEHAPFIGRLKIGMEKPSRGRAFI